MLGSWQFVKVKYEKNHNSHGDSLHSFVAQFLEKNKILFKYAEIRTRYKYIRIITGRLCYILGDWLILLCTWVAFDFTVETKAT